MRLATVSDYDDVVSRAALEARLYVAKNGGDERRTRWVRQHVGMLVGLMGDGIIWPDAVWDRVKAQAKLPA